MYLQKYDYYQGSNFRNFSLQPILVRSEEKETTPNEKGLEKCQANGNIESSSNESLNHVVDELVEAALASNQYSQGSQVSSDSLDEALTQGRNMTIKDVYDKDEVQDLPYENNDKVNDNGKENQKRNDIHSNLASSNEDTTSYQRQTKGK